MAATQAAPVLPTGTEFADSLIRVTERLSALMETEVDLLRGNRARDIKALQTDKESLTAVYQRMICLLYTSPSPRDS